MCRLSIFGGIASEALGCGDGKRCNSSPPGDMKITKIVSGRLKKLNVLCRLVACIDNEGDCFTDTPFRYLCWTKNFSTSVSITENVFTVAENLADFACVIEILCDSRS